jgi:hypothetical protein
VVAITRSLREQIDWPGLRSRCSGSPYAKAYLTLVEELEIAPRSAQTPAGAAGANRVRVVPG